MTTGPVSVEPVEGRVARRRFLELPYTLHRDDPRWAPPLVAYDRWRLDRYSHPFYVDGYSERWLVRRRGRIVGRAMAHVAAEGDDAGWFGFFDVADDAGAAAALLDQVAAWLRDEECTSMTGPVSPTEADEAGLLVDGFSIPGVTGRPWHPEWYAAHIEAAGLTAVRPDRTTWRSEAGGHADSPFAESGGDRPRHAGRWTDARLVGRDAAAVPDVAEALRRSPLALARQARTGFTTCCVVRGDSAPAIRALAARAGEVGFRSVITPVPVGDPGTPPETRHRLYSITL